VNREPTFVDTWGWVALGNRRDAHHDSVTGLFRTFQSDGIPIYTSDYVLDELITLLFRRESYDRAAQFMETLLAAREAHELTVDRITSPCFDAAWELRKRFQDKPCISFTDLCSMAIMLERGISQVITDDDHFLHVGLGFETLP